MMRGRGGQGRGRSVAALAAVMLVVSACGSDEAEVTKVADTTTTAADSGDATSTTAGGGSGDAGVGEAWALTATAYRDRLGDVIDVECPAGGTLASVWGSNVYTDDSSICSAAVHAELITTAKGGDVRIEIVEGQDEYLGSTFNGVESSDYGVYPGSFSFPDAEPLEVAADIDWTRNAIFYKGRDQTTFTVTCVAGGPTGSVWGTGIYTADSSICTAGVHAGLITVAAGGELTFELTPGADLYVGTEANGVTSTDYGAYDSSFEFVTD